MDGLNIDTSSPVLVTGASGYVAGWVVKRLLEEGLTVHGTVRDPSNKTKVAALEAMGEELPGTLKLFKADLLDEGSFAEAMAGCSVVFHTASPYRLDIRDPQKELVEPAQLGTRNVLEQVNATVSVKRVVLTSSCAAIYGDNIDIEAAPNGVLTEEVWNTTSSLEHQPYSYSKTVAEKEAWSIHDVQSRWRLVVLNPALVMGPGIDPRGSSESFTIIRQMGDGSGRFGVPAIGFGCVDVRDLADAHLRAAFVPDAQGRHIIRGHATSLLEMASTLIPKYGDTYPIPRRTLPKWVIWLTGPLLNAGLTRAFVSKNVGYPWRGDNSKSIRELGMSYRPLSETMNDFFEQMVSTGQLK